MENDCLYAMGRSHRECQDYARSTAGFAVLSDGCSSSAMSDVGARNLSNAAMLRNAVSAEAFDIDWVLRRAGKAARYLGLAPSSLDATLLVAQWDKQDGLRCWAAGDGVIAVRHRSGRLSVWDIDDGPAPAYLSYQQDEKRLQSYWRQWGSSRRVTQFVDSQVVEIVMESMTETYVFSRSWPLADVEAIFLMSDGVKSFVDGNGEAVPLQKVVEQVCGIRSYKGAFVARRVGRFLKKTCVSRNWFHEDDISVAALYFPEEEHGRMG